MAISQGLETTEAIFAKAHELAGKFAVEAAARDRERRFPYEEMNELKTSGLQALCLPAEQGGLGRSYGDACRVMQILAEADPCIAQMALVHWHGHELFASLAGHELRAEFAERLVREDLWWTNAHSERKGKTILDYKLTMEPDGADWVINGTKFYATGSQAGNETYVNGLIPGTSDWRMAFVPMDAEGLTVHEDWDAMGQVTTASGSMEFNNVRVPARRVAEVDVVLSLGSAESLVSGVLPQCMFGAIFVGIAKAALRDMIDYLRNKSRPWIHSDVERAADDPYALLRVGEMVTLVDTADLLQERAIQFMDETRADNSPQARGLASVRAAQTKSYASQVAIDAGETLFKVCGASSTLRKYNYDRHWRNARTLSLHDPADYKAKLVAEWAVNQEIPPVTMYT